MRKTGILEKLLPSLINAVIVLCITAPIFWIASITVWKISVVVAFFFYNLFFLIFNGNRCLGMILCNTEWPVRPPFYRELAYIILYTLSFATLFMWIWFPFDVFIFNMLLLQLPSIVLTGTTFHGLVVGNKYSVVKKEMAV